MGKLLAGMLVTLVAALTLVPPAGAAEIPPTGKCVKTAKKLLVKFSKLPEDASPAQFRKANRNFMIGLAEANCISDAEPHLKKLKPEPFTDECYSAAAVAEGYWGPLAIQVRNLIKPWRKKAAPVRKRLKRLNSRVQQLRVIKAPTKRIKTLIQRRNVARADKDRIMRKFIRQADPVLRPAFIDTFLILLELSSLRCVSVDDTFEDDNLGPAGSVVSKRERIILTSLFYEDFRLSVLTGRPPVGALASSVAGDRPKLPYIPIP